MTLTLTKHANDPTAARRLFGLGEDPVDHGPETHGHVSFPTSITKGVTLPSKV